MTVLQLNAMGGRRDIPYRLLKTREYGQLADGVKDLKAESVRVKDITEELVEAVLR